MGGGGCVSMCLCVCGRWVGGMCVSECVCVCECVHVYMYVCA